VTKAELYVLREDAVEKYAAYIDSEIRLWDDKDGFTNLSLYKAFKRAKSRFHAANGKWEEALLEYASGFL
jgi:hypothetical protein